MITLFLALTAGMLVFFIVVYLGNRRILSKMTIVERSQLAIEEAQIARTKLSRKERLSRYLANKGYIGDLGPVYLVFAALYVGAVVLGHLIHLTLLLAAPIALIVALFAMNLAIRNYSNRQKDKFNTQLLDAFQLINSNIKSGDTPVAAISKTIPSLANPLQYELSHAISSIVGQERDLIIVLRELEAKYQSKALNMFITALEINRDSNVDSLAPTLESLILLLQRTLSLQQEGIAELASAKSTLYLTMLGLSALIFVMLLSSPNTAAALFHGTGIFIFIFACTWFFGITALIYRSMRKVKEIYL
jgi:Flp pilus assembly protein TadB